MILMEKPLRFMDLSRFLSQADVIISATTCPIPFINKRLVEEALSQRKDAPMFFLDLAVPRDIEPQIHELAPVHLYNIDDLQVIIEKGMDKRHQAALYAEQLIEKELNQFVQKQRVLKAKNLICDYRNQMHHLAQKELEQALKKLAAGLCQQRILNELSERLVNQLVDIPTTMSIRHSIKEDHDEVMRLAHYLFSKI